MHYRTIWLSDIHLGTKGCQAGKLLDFLAQAQSETLYLVGDIFDGWELKKKWYWPPEHQNVVQTFLQRARDGVRVVYIPGNHDEIARDYLDKNFSGIPVINELVHVTADGKRFLVLHGDQFDAVMGYAKWLAKLGSAAYGIALAINWVFNHGRRALGLSYWSLSAYLKQKVKGAVNGVSDFETFLVEAARRNNCTGLICGHIHRAEIRMVEDILYCNDGDWVESCTALVEHPDGKLELIHWPPQNTPQLP
jgi:UDP-2,3-diacylglucosamine pyrophosphatase LpxH